MHSRLHNHSRLHQGWIVSGLLAVPLLVGCGSSSKDEDIPPPPELGLDGLWQGQGLVTEPLGVTDSGDPEFVQVVVNTAVSIDFSEIEGVQINSAQFLDTGFLTEDALSNESRFFLYAINFILDDGTEVGGSQETMAGAMLTDADKAYALMVIDNMTSMHVLGREGPLPEGRDVSLLDVRGEWEGFVLRPLFGTGTPDQFPVSMTCATDSAGVCVATARGPVRDANGQYVIRENAAGDRVWDLTGQQWTLTVAPRQRLLFDHSYTGTMGLSGSGLLMLSSDQQFMGLSACEGARPGAAPAPTACSLAILQRR